MSSCEHCGTTRNSATANSTSSARLVFGPHIGSFPHCARTYIVISLRLAMRPPALPFHVSAPSSPLSVLVSK
eukprot:scaffold229099_cov32-Tisochrysis_lutea.AAC.1